MKLILPTHLELAHESEIPFNVAYLSKLLSIIIINFCLLSVYIYNGLLVKSH